MRQPKLVALVVIAFWASTPLLSQPNSASAQDAVENKVTLAGIRPTKGAELGELELRGIRESQELRATIESIIELLSGESVEGHESLRELLGPSYLVSQFDCEDDIRCLLKLFIPLKKRGFKDVFLGAMFVENGQLTVRIDQLSLMSRKIDDSRTITLPANAIGDPKSWITGLSPFFNNSGSLTLKTNVKDFECVVDGEECLLDENLTQTLAQGDHIIELRKEGYTPAASAFKVTKGENKSLAIAMVALPDSKYFAANNAQTRDLKLGNFSAGLQVFSEVSYRSFSDRDKALYGSGNLIGIALTAKGSLKDLRVGLNYVYIGSFEMVRQAFAGYDITDNLSVEAGLPSAPVGHATSVGFQARTFSLVGLETDLDVGAKLLYSNKDFKADVAFFKNAEGPLDSPGRFNADIIASDFDGDGVNEYDDEEVNEINLGIKYSAHPSKVLVLNIGASGRLGQLYNNTLDRSGYHWAAEGHLEAEYDKFTAEIAAARYDFRPQHPDGLPADRVAMGSFGLAYEISAQGTIAAASVRWLDKEFNKGPLDFFGCFEEASLLEKDTNGSKTTLLNVVGCVAGAGPIFAQAETLIGRDHPYVGGASDSLVLGAGRWDYQFRLLFGFSI